MNKSRGFTLIEVLLAMTLLSMVMFAGSLSFSIFSSRWQKDLGDFSTQVGQAKKMLLLKSLFNGTSSYIVKTKSDEPVYLFEGEAAVMRFVSNNPILNPGQVALVRLVVRELDNGSQQLIYQEYPMAEHWVFTTADQPELMQSLVLMEGSNIRFNYFGWHNKETRARAFEGDDVLPEWRTDYHAEQSGILPEAINISWGDNEPVIFSLPSDNANKLIYTNEKQSDA